MILQKNTTRIVASSYWVPEGRLTHEMLSERFGTETMDKIASSSGILERRISAEGECASDLAYRAASDLFESAPNIPASSIDLVVFATQTPDYLLPTTACMLQDRLHIPKHAAALDINLGCSQYVYALAVAHSMIASGLRTRALVMTGDTVSKILHPQDRMVVPLFGDAATATVMEASTLGGFEDFIFGSDGSGAKHLIWPTSGLRLRPDAESGTPTTDKYGNVRSQNEMYMDGTAIFVFTLKTIPEVVGNLLRKNSISIADVDLFIFHQASEAIILASAKKLGIPSEKLHFKLHDVGNSGGSTVGIALTDAVLAGKLKPGMKVVLAAFGVGLSWSSALITWPEEECQAVCTADFSASPAKPVAQV